MQHLIKGFVGLSLSIYGLQLISETSEAYLGTVMNVSDFMETVDRSGGVT